MGRWLKKISETGSVPTDNTDKSGSVSLVSDLSPRFQKKNADVYSGTQGVLTDKADKDGSVSVVSTLPPHIQKTQNPDALLLDIAAMLQANPDHLYALLCEDDIQDIADGANSRAYMLDYFRLMRTDGKLPVSTAQPPAKATESPQGYIESAKAWKPAHEAMMNHVTDCTACRAPQGRYCNEGADLRRAYWNAHQSAVSPSGVEES
jgi:hypothetical protein